MITTLVQVLLLLTMVLLCFYFLTNRRKARARAGVKVGFAIMIIGAIWAVFRPEDVTAVAHWVGIGRGTDLMLYVLIIAFAFTTLSTWIRFREQELRYAQLARAVALQNAVQPAERNLGQNSSDN
jgi:hypothetical protein